jgi:hypothetical protein
MVLAFLIFLSYFCKKLVAMQGMSTQEWTWFAVMLGTGVFIFQRGSTLIREYRRSAVEAPEGDRSSSTVIEGLMSNPEVFRRAYRRRSLSIVVAILTPLLFLVGFHLATVFGNGRTLQREDWYVLGAEVLIGGVLSMASLYRVRQLLK